MSISIDCHTVPNNMLQTAILKFLNLVMLAEKQYATFTIKKSTSSPFGMLPRFQSAQQFFENYLQSKLYKTA
jgi:hypothetical protein